jgi:hypothetical protein
MIHLLAKTTYLPKMHFIVFLEKQHRQHQHSFPGQASGSGVNIINPATPDAEFTRISQHDRSFH